MLKLFRFNQKAELFALCGLMILFTLRIALPQYVKFLLFPGVLLLFLYSLIIFIKEKIIDKRKMNLSRFIFAIFAIILTYILSFAITQDKQLDLLKDGFNNLLVILYIFSFYVLVKDFTSLKNILSYFSRLIFAIGSIVAILGLTKLILQLYGIKLNILNVEGYGYPSGTSLSVDNNFFTLFCFISAIFSLPYFFRSNSKVYGVIIQIAFFLLLLSIFFATSRRGLIIAGFFLTLIIVLWITSLFNNKGLLKHYRRNTLLLLLLLLLFSISFFSFIYRFTTIERNRLLVNSSFDRYEFGGFMNWLILSGKTIFKGDADYYEVKDELWQTTFDPRLPYSGWASGNYQIVENLIGNGSEILPKGSIGALINNSEKGSTLDGNAYYYSKLFENEINKEKRYLVSIYCYVSPDFDGDWVRISSHGQLNGLTSSYYNLNNKGQWQKLQLSFDGDTGVFKTYFYFCKKNVNDFTNLNGYVVFAYPELIESRLDPHIPLTWAGSNFKEVNLFGKNVSIVPQNSKGYLLDLESDFNISKASGNYYSYTQLFNIFISSNTKRLISSVYCYVSSNFNGDKVRIGIKGEKVYGEVSCYYDLDHKGTWQKLIIKNYTNNEYLKPFLFFEIPYNKKPEELNGHVVFAYPKYEILEFSAKKPYTFVVNNFEEVFPIEGINSDMIPSGTIGYKFNNKTIGRIWKNLYYSSNQFLSVDVNPGDSVYSSVYCYVSNDFNGNEVRLELNGKVNGQIKSKYDFASKGKWVRLEVKGLAAENGRISGNTFFSQWYVNNFKNLNGYVIFAYPVLNVIESKRTSKLDSKLNVPNYVTHKASFLSIAIFESIINNEKKMNDTSEIYNGFKKELVGDHFSGPRLDRWRYAIYLYKNDYNWIEKILGGGFGYTKKFAKTFDSQKGYDYPHNPFLSVLLYSGIVGLLIYIWFLFKAAYYYWIYRKEYWTFALAFGASFFYSFFSSNTPFEPAIMGVLTIIPYFIHYYTINEKEMINE